MNRMASFRQTLIDNSLTDLGAIGPKFTWNNKRDDQDNVMVRLDRYVADNFWIDNYPGHRVHNFNFYLSDHRPIRLDTNPTAADSPRSYTPKFTFEHKWVIEEDFEKIIEDGWGRLNSDWKLSEKLDHLAKTLSEWAKNKLGSLPKEIKRDKEELNKNLNEERKPFKA